MRFATFYMSLIFITWTACTTMESDAQKAAELTAKSLTAAKEHKLKASEKYYISYKKIETKYKEKGKLEYKEFEEAYWKYVNKGKD